MDCLGGKDKKCENCILRVMPNGSNFGNVPEIDTYKNSMRIAFGTKVVARDFARYFGYIQEQILSKEKEEIIIDFLNTSYINHFCISKIMLTLFPIRKEKKVVFIFPNDFDDNKMLRFLYNLGILNFIFNDHYFECFAGGEKIHNYTQKYDFSECYDYAIYPYTIFDLEIGSDNNNTIEGIIKSALLFIQSYYATRNQIEKYRQIESRVHLYLFEIIDNIFQHAYEKRAIFAINIYNSYLPPYKILNGSKEEKKFANRIARLQHEVPMSVYKGIHDRYFGGFNIFIDDIGKSIQNTYRGSSLENVYKDVYLNGSKKRKTINGLKLVADQIATNCDMLWAHDGRCWISTSFIENSNIVKSDESKTLSYRHPAIKGLTYDLFINLAKNSKEKKKTYEQFGYKISYKIDEINKILSDNAISSYSKSVFVDLLNLVNKNKSFKTILNTKKNYLFYRPRATQKNKMSSELQTRIIDKFSDKSKFNYLIVYDLNQTTLFQIKAVFESKEIASELTQRGINTILLLTEESWLFAMEIEEDVFVFRKKAVEKYKGNYNVQDIYAAIYHNDVVSLDEVLKNNFSEYLVTGKIQWGFREISEYLDIEKMIVDRAIFDLLCKSIARISGMLDESVKIVFLEKFMERAFGSLVNEYKNNTIQNIFLGSIIMNGETEKKLANNNDLKIYLFKHRGCNVELKNNHLILFALPDVNKRKSAGIHRRILNTNRIEKCSEQSEEYKYYLSDTYKDNIRKVTYVVGFYPTGFFSIEKNQVLYKGYLEFVLQIIKIQLRKFDVVALSLGDDITDQFVVELKKKTQKIENDNEFRNLGKKIYINNISDTSIELIIKLGEKIDLIDMMTDMNHSKNEVIYVPIFNNIQFESNFPKVLDAGYMPYLPLYYVEGNFFITNGTLEKFNSFVRSLNPHYRNVLEVGLEDKDRVKMPEDFTNAVFNFYVHLTDTNGENGTHVDLLWDVIYKNINGISDSKIAVGLVRGQYEIFINALLLQHSIVKLSSMDKTKLINNILIFFWENHNAIQDSTITYLLLIIIKSVSIEDNILESLFDVEVGKEILASKSDQLRILFADLYNENCRFKFETELNDFFVSNDIAIYYNMLSQLLFNSHGTIHDSKLDAIYKKLVENVDNVTDQDIIDINNIIPNCLSLLKLTKSYDQSIKKEEELEQKFFQYNKNMKNNLQNIRILIDEITVCAKDRFEIINKDYVEDGIQEYYNKIVNVLCRKKYNIREEISNLIISMGDDCEINAEGHIKRNINLYKDTIIFEELAYLLHNAHSHSYQAFSLTGNADKKYLVWVKAELHSNNILLRLFNSIDKSENSFNNAVKAIQDKKRIGKTYLEKFNIHVLYYENPQGIIDSKTGINVFETRIEIPYFN